MPKPLKESIVQSKVKAYFESEGWLVVKIIQCTLNGWPDLQLHKAGKTFFIETKTESGKVTPLQEYRHEQLRKQGFEVYVIYNLNEIKYVKIS